MINAKKKEGFPPNPGTIVLRQKDINLITGKPFRIKTCCSSQMLIYSLREDTDYLLDLGVNGMGQSNRTLLVVWLGRVNRYAFPRIKYIKYRNLNQVTRAEIYFSLKRERFVGKNNAASWVLKLTLLKWLSRVGSEVGLTKGEKGRRRKKTRKRVEREREEPALDGEKDESVIGVERR
ncbi:hypothetical protein TNCV_3647671 [Trichonephila clavipes]|nr:hypothetical protein TNCV_3647671 [Trichonephila clavipes]